jgi:hypothetical protein
MLTSEFWQILGRRSIGFLGFAFSAISISRRIASEREGLSICCFAQLSTFDLNAGFWPRHPAARAQLQSAFVQAACWRGNRYRPILKFFCRRFRLAVIVDERWLEDL